MREWIAEYDWWGRGDGGTFVQFDIYHHGREVGSAGMWERPDGTLTLDGVPTLDGWMSRELMDYTIAAASTDGFEGDEFDEILDAIKTAMREARRPRR